MRTALGLDVLPTGLGPSSNVCRLHPNSHSLSARRPPVRHQHASKSHMYPRPPRVRSSLSYLAVRLQSLQIQIRAVRKRSQWLSALSDDLLAKPCQRSTPHALFSPALGTLFLLSLPAHRPSSRSRFVPASMTCLVSRRSWAAPIPPFPASPRRLFTSSYSQIAPHLKPRGSPSCTFVCISNQSRCLLRQSAVSDSSEPAFLAILCSQHLCMPSEH